MLAKWILCLILLSSLSVKAATCQNSVFQYQNQQLTCAKMVNAVLPSHFQVGSYNLHGLLDPAGLKKDLSSIPKVQIWGFEEVNGYKNEIVPQNLLAALPSGTWFIYIQAVNTIDTKTGEWEGQAVLSRFPFMKVEKIPLAHSDVKARVALAASFADFTFIDTDHEVHVGGGIDFNDRKKQLESLNTYLNLNPAPAVVTGDFNTTGGNTEIAQTEEVLSLSNLVRSPADSSSTYTFRKFFYTAELDHFFSRGLEVSKRHRLDARVGSDHYPVFIDITL